MTGELPRHGTHGALLQVQTGTRRPRRAAFRQRFWPQNLQQRLEEGLGRVGRAPEDAAQRIPPAAVDPRVSGIPGRADAAIFLWRRRGAAEGICSAKSLGWNFALPPRLSEV